MNSEQKKRNMTENEMFVEINNVLIGCQIVLDALDVLEKQKFYKHKMKYAGNSFKKEIENMFVISFIGAERNTANYFNELSDYIKYQSIIFQHIYAMEESEKTRVLLALDNFYTTNIKTLRELR